MPPQDRECVDEILAMEQDKLKFAKRKLRVQRCKTLPGGPAMSHTPGITINSTASPSSSSHAQVKAKSRPIRLPVVVPKGDPSLGARLSTLSKDERKAAKATDTARVARRAAKKAAKLNKALESKGVAEDKTRIRKRPAGRKGPGVAKKEVKKRVMKDRAIAKRNVKK
jgi:nucleolar protein 12